MKRYVNAALTKRFGAFILDLFTIVFTATIIYSLLGKALVNTRAFKEANTIMNEIKDEIKLETWKCFDAMIWKKNTFGGLDIDNEYALSVINKTTLSP